MRRLGFFLSKLVLIRPRRVEPACVTHMSRGKERTAAWLSMGLTRITMIESLRSPYAVRFPKPPAYGESLAMHALLSEPVIKKFLAFRSPIGKSNPLALGSTESMVTTLRLLSFQFAYKRPEPERIVSTASVMLARRKTRCLPERLEEAVSSDMPLTPYLRGRAANSRCG